MIERKRISQVYLLFLFVSCLIISTPVYANDAQVAVEDVRIEKTFPDTWGVVGKIRNLGRHPIRGYVKIKFLDSRGDILRSNLAPVNDKDPLRPGQAGPFDYYTNRRNFDGVESFDIIFIELSR